MMFLNEEDQVETFRSLFKLKDKDDKKYGMQKAMMKGSSEVIVADLFYLFVSKALS